MKTIRVKTIRVTLLAIGLVVASLTGGLMVTNPSSEDYELYSTQRLTDYAEENLCKSGMQLLDRSLSERCSELLHTNRAEIRKLIKRSTKRQNFLILSIYRTNLSAKSLLPFLPPEFSPSYRFETIGILKGFYTYKAESQ